MDIELVDEENEVVSDQYPPDVISDGCVYFCPDAASFCEEYGFKAISIYDGLVTGLCDDHKWRTPEDAAKEAAKRAPRTLARVQ